MARSEWHDGAEVAAARARVVERKNATRRMALGALVVGASLVAVIVASARTCNLEHRDRLAAIAASVSAEQAAWNRVHPPSDAGTVQATPLARVVEAVPTASAAAAATETDPIKKHANICPYAAKRAIKKMNECGLNTEGFTVDDMCKRFGYDRLSFIGSRSCAELGAILFPGE